MNYKSNRESRSKIICFLPVVLGGLIIIANVPAQQVTTNNLPSPQSPAPGLPVPVSNQLVLSTGNGTVRMLDSKGLLLVSDHGYYLPRVKISDLSDSDLHSLLEARAAYAALTTFGPIIERNAQSAAFENQLRQVWLHGKSLSEKIQTRLLLLDYMRAYNADITYLPALTAAASDAAARASTANNQLALNDQAATNAESESNGSRQQAHNARLANERAARAEHRASAANYQSAVANQSLQNYVNACAAISRALAGYGIHVPESAPFSPVPPLSMRPEVDAERMAAQ